MTERKLPILAVIRTDIDDARIICPTTDNRETEPQRVIPATEQVDPTRKKDRRLRTDPSAVASKMDILLANLAQPRRLSEDPKLVSCITETVLADPN
jgi:hypothetical protein